MISFEVLLAVFLLQKSLSIFMCCAYSAGVGRTGAFIALDYLLEQAEAEGTIDLFGLTARMRKDRSNMIQTVVRILVQ